MSAYYNEIDPYPAQWMRNLIDAGHMAPGVVDNRSILEVEPEDIGNGQAHFFAGIGVWSHALRLAGVPDGAPVWTGSCPCQPFSTAGKRRGADDERHLWPVWFRLIAERRPAIVFGEQVASASGRDWLSAVRADMEALGYAVGGSDLCAAGAGSDHARQRLFWVAYAIGESGRVALSRAKGGRDTIAQADGGCGASAGVGSDHARQRLFGVAYASGERLKGLQLLRRGRSEARWCREDGAGVGDADDARLQRHGRSVAVHDAGGREAAERYGAEAGFWLPPVERWWVECSDPVRGRLIRPAEPGTFPLAHGAAARVGRLRAYGNAINARIAAVFIRSSLEAIAELEGVRL